MFRPTTPAPTIARATLPHALLMISLVFLAWPALAQSSQDDKPFDVRSSVGDMHVGKDADAASAGLPLYPGARPKRDKDNDPLNFGLLSESFGFKIVVAKYESDDDPSRIISFYRDKLKKYGKVIECHPQDDSTHADVNSDDNKDEHSRALKCEGDNNGPVTELKAGTEDNQHVVAIEPRGQSKRTTFAVVYLYSRGKKGEL